MKKVNLTALKLNKKSVSNLQTNQVTGGSDRETRTFINGLCHCPAPSRGGGTNTACFCQ